MPAAYRILDEPRPGALQRIAVNPVWPLFGFLFAGAWLSWPWFVVNAIAVGSPTRMKEFAWAVAGFLGIGAWVVVLGALLDLGIIGVEQGPWATIALVLWKLAISYRLYMLQASTFEIYAYFGGVVRNGAIAVFIGYLVWARFLSGWLETHAKGLETLLR